MKHKRTHASGYMVQKRFEERDEFYDFFPDPDELKTMEITATGQVRINTQHDYWKKVATVFELPLIPLSAYIEIGRRSGPGIFSGTLFVDNVDIMDAEIVYSKMKDFRDISDATYRIIFG